MKKRNFVITIVSSIIVVLFTGIYIANMYGGIGAILDSFMGTVPKQELPEDVQNDVSGKYTLTKTLSKYYDPLKSEIDFSEENHYKIKVLDALISKDKGELIIHEMDREYLGEGVLLGSNGRLENDYSFLKVILEIENAYDQPMIFELQRFNIVCQLAEVLNEGQMWKDDQYWLTLDSPKFLDTEFEYDGTKDKSMRFNCAIPAGETNKVELGFILNDRNLNDENAILIEIFPDISGVVWDWDPEYTGPKDYYAEICQTPEMDVDARYICLNQFLGFKPYAMPLTEEQKKEWKWLFGENAL